METAIDTPTDNGPDRTPPRGSGALAGLIAVAVALAVAELFVGIVGRGQSVIVSIGNWVIGVSPEPLVKWAIRTFGTADKLVLVVSILATLFLLGSMVGVVATRRLMPAAVAFVGAGILGLILAATDPVTDVTVAAVAIVLAVFLGFTALVVLVRKRRLAVTDDSRRSFLTAMGVTAVMAGIGAMIGRSLVNGISAASERAGISLPTSQEGPVAVPDGAQVDGAVPVITPNEDFYLIDTALRPPPVDLATWTLTIKGMVDEEVVLTYDDLSALATTERIVTLSCVSNSVGGSLVGTAKWLGVPLRDVLDMAGVQEGATQIVGRAIDDFTVGFPTEAAYDGRDALIAIGMNDEPLPVDHGYPARLVVAGLYGYVSATKWLSEIELTTWDGFDAYWVPRGWSKTGPIKTQSRIDSPTKESNVATGLRRIAGVAWAPNIGIDAVEVSIDGGEWIPATLGEPLGDNAWRQWYVEWDAPSGRHTIAVRATDSSGYTQTAELAAPRPDGATGHHTIAVNVA
ncbi:MAG: molybdopterin-dependent oxidoreductase [Acidimicrobiia bacterium]|nr:molybdopterin-dependent oxidoreductase [Acidimicrobiia bacterium]MDH5504681.1 molybdopterin-dependent oxidoreductase [Acidimicrobiia bacterium]